MSRHTDHPKNDILSKYLTVLGNCYSTGIFDALFPILAADAVMESQWVLEPNVGKAAVVDYYTEKGKTLRENDCCPHCWLIQLSANMNKGENAEAHITGEEESPRSFSLFYPDGKYALFMAQTLNDEENGVVVDLTLDEYDRIARIDLCMPELFKFETIQNVDDVIDLDDDTFEDEEDAEDAEDEEDEEYIPWDNYYDCRFAVETTEHEIIAFNDNLQAELFEKYLTFTGLTKAKIIQMLADDYNEGEDEDLPEGSKRCFEDDFEAMGISVEDGKIVFSNMVGERGFSTKELLEELGWECSFEGDSWKLETIGVYFIE